MKKIILLFAILSIISCSDDFIEDNLIDSKITNERETIAKPKLSSTIGITPSTTTMTVLELAMMMSLEPIDPVIPTHENVFVALVAEGSCGPTDKASYSIYAASSNVYDYDRKVHAAVIKNGTFVEAKILTIPAGQSTSNNVIVFVGASSSYGKVRSRAYNILVNGGIVNGYNFPSISYNVSNCFIGVGSSDCNEGIYAADNPYTVANEGPGDQDNDGICNNYDEDDNGNYIPDVFED